MPRFAQKSSKRRPRSDDPEWASGVGRAVTDYPDDESSGMYSLDNLVESWNKKQKTMTVILPDAVEMQLSNDDSCHSMESADTSVAPPPPPPPLAATAAYSSSVRQSSVQVRDSTTTMSLEDDQEPRKPRGNGRRYVVGGVLLALVCIAAVVVVSVIAPAKRAPSATVSSSSSNVMNGNDGGANTPSDPVLSREESLTKMALGLSSPEALGTPGSPQAQALEWLIHTDGAMVSVSGGRSEEEEQQVQERYILAVFYYATGGVNWFDSFYFLSQNHVCNWKNLDFGMGVECDDGSPTVTGFKFGPNNLQGSLPEEIFRLNGMKTFQVIMNPGLTGSIPSSVGTQENLQILNLNKNALGGEIPKSLLSLPSLTTLWMDENAFEGSIPTSMEPGSTLTWWSCNNCGLTGRMPDSLRIPPLL